MTTGIDIMDTRFRQERRAALVRAMAMTREAITKEYNSVMSQSPQPTAATMAINGGRHVSVDAKLTALDETFRRELADIDHGT